MSERPETERAAVPRETSGETAGADASDPTFPRRARALMTIAACAWGIYAVVDAALGHRTAFWINVCGMSGTTALAVVAWKRPALTRGVSHVAVALSVGALLAIAQISGQTLSPVMWFLACIPLFTGYLHGARAAVGWSLVCAAGVVVVELWRQRAPIAPYYEMSPPDIAGRIVALVSLILTFAIATARIHRKQLTNLQESRTLVGDLLAQAEHRAEELSTARDAAIEASRAKGNFLAVMSHEIRTPLNAVLGLTGVLLDAPLPPEQREIVRMIRSSGDTLLSLLNDVLDFSKIEAGGLTLERAPFDVGDCMEDAVDLFATVAAEKDIDLSVHLGPEVPPRIEGDATRVRQILVNLVSNAVKFTPRGSIAVRARATEIQGEPDALSIHCTVKDTGIGIPAERVDEIFREFSQADASTTRRFGGTGLGLAICRALAERMGGRVWVESEKGKGATFHVTFRAKSVTHTGEIVSLAGIGSSAVVASPREGTRSAVMEQVEMMGLAAVPCRSVAEIAEALANARPDVLVADEALADDELRALLDATRPAPRVLLLAAPKREGAKPLRERWPQVPAVPIPPRRSLVRETLLQLMTGQGLNGPRSSGNPAPGVDPGLRILVAEDNPVNQKVMQLLLERLGCRADVAGNGLETLEAVQARPYDLVFMDMRMPEMDGPTATRRIRAVLPPDRQPRIVALTANVTTEDRAMCEAAGMDDFVGKPITSADLIRALRARTPRRRPISEMGIGPAPGAGGKNPSLEALRLALRDPVVFASIIDEYVVASRQLLTELEAAAQSADLTACADLAHTVKGASGQMGATAVMQQAIALERAAKDGDATAVRALLPAIRAAHDATVEELRAAKEQA